MDAIGARADAASAARDVGLQLADFVEAGLKSPQKPEQTSGEVMLIRVETGIDAPGIDALLRRTFGSRCRSAAGVVMICVEELTDHAGVVATDDEGQVIGYVAFSPVAVEGEELQWVGPAPLAVDERYRGQGIGPGSRFGEGLDSLNEFGYAAVVTLGDLIYTVASAFEPAARFDLLPPLAGQRRGVLCSPSGG